MENVKYKTRTRIILAISIIGILYAPFSMALLKNNLIPITGVITEVDKSGTRIPYYEFKMDNYPSTFYNSGNGFLSKFKNDEDILFGGINKEITFYINKNDLPKLKTGDEVKYIGLWQKNIYLDMYYYLYTGLGGFLLAFLYLSISCLNVYGMCVIKKRIFEKLYLFFIAYYIINLAL